MWPAFWMLGDNITTASWPTCGEIDVMENRGSAPGVIDSTLHGLAAGDFDRALRGLLGEAAPVSAASVARPLGRKGADLAVAIRRRSTFSLNRSASVRALPIR